jgi:bifunctional non-homologous end joining protein LigD
LTLVRCPNGIRGERFFQKHWTAALPAAVHGVLVEEKSAKEKYVVIEDLPGLVSLVQIGALELHPWPARTDDLEHPDRLVIDLDPAPDVPWSAVARGAQDVRDRLDGIGLESFLRTSGGKGLHVVVPLGRRNTWSQLKELAQALADSLVAQDPGRYIATASKARRQGKVFVDYLRNQRGATAVASYSTRALEGATVATPLSWDELERRSAPEKYSVKTVPQRLAALPRDPWAGFFALRQTIREKMLSALKNT